MASAASSTMTLGYLGIRQLVSPTGTIVQPRYYVLSNIRFVAVIPYSFSTFFGLAIGSGVMNGNPPIVCN
eukprot:scaffold11458_cov57-Skeletonema_menzelii.AAC.1